MNEGPNEDDPQGTSRRIFLRRVNDALNAARAAGFHFTLFV